MRIAYVTTYDANDVARSWSGTGYFMKRALAGQGLSVADVGNLREPLGTLGLKIACRARLKLLGRAPLWERYPSVLRKYATQVEKALVHQAVDAVFSPGTLPLSYLQTDLPVVFWTDATFAGVIDFYTPSSRVTLKSIRQGNDAERRALEIAALAIYSSDWAASTAVTEYGVDSSKVAVVPFGANLDTVRSREDTLAAIHSRPVDRCRLLFNGVDWSRKGLDKALEVAHRLNAARLPTELWVLGCELPRSLSSSSRSLVHNLGFIDKRTSDGQELISDVFARSHFLILPTRADATPMVICEASAFGVPSLASAVGGIPSIVKSGLNGETFAPSATADEYCEYILSLWGDSQKYQELALSARVEYETRLNWRSAARSVRELMQERIRG